MVLTATKRYTLGRSVDNNTLSTAIGIEMEMKSVIASCELS